MGRIRSGKGCNHCGAATSQTICQACRCTGCERLFVLCDCDTQDQQKQFQKKAKDLFGTTCGQARDTGGTQAGQSQKRDTTQTLDDRKTSANLPHRDAETNQKASLQRPVSFLY